MKVIRPARFAHQGDLFFSLLLLFLLLLHFDQPVGLRRRFVFRALSVRPPHAHASERRLVLLRQVQSAPEGLRFGNSPWRDQERVLVVDVVRAARRDQRLRREEGARFVRDSDDDVGDRDGEVGLDVLVDGFRRFVDQSREDEILVGHEVQHYGIPDVAPKLLAALAARHGGRSDGQDAVARQLLLRRLDSRLGDLLERHLVVQFALDKNICGFLRLFDFSWIFSPVDGIRKILCLLFQKQKTREFVAAVLVVATDSIDVS